MGLMLWSASLMLVTYVTLDSDPLWSNTWNEMWHVSMHPISHALQMEIWRKSWFNGVSILVCKGATELWILLFTLRRSPLTTCRLGMLTWDSLSKVSIGRIICVRFQKELASVQRFRHKKQRQWEIDLPGYWGMTGGLGSGRSMTSSKISSALTLVFLRRSIGSGREASCSATARSLLTKLWYTSSASIVTDLIAHSSMSPPSSRGDCTFSRAWVDWWTRYFSTAKRCVTYCYPVLNDQGQVFHGRLSLSWHFSFCSRYLLILLLVGFETRAQLWNLFHCLRWGGGFAFTRSKIILLNKTGTAFCFFSSRIRCSISMWAASVGGCGPGKTGSQGPDLNEKAFLSKGWSWTSTNGGGEGGGTHWSLGLRKGSPLVSNFPSSIPS